MKDNTQKHGAFKEMISGDNGFISSKRVMGIIILSFCIICTGWLVYKEGGTEIVENLLQTLMIMAAALLGISSIAGIWRTGNDKTIKKEDLIDKNENNPCDTCIHNRN